MVFFFIFFLKGASCQVPWARDEKTSNMSPNLVRMGYKTHVLYHPIKDCHISILLKIKCILPHLITS